MNTWIVWMALPVTFWIHGPDFVREKFKDVDLWKHWMQETMRSDVIPAIPG